MKISSRSAFGGTEMKGKANPQMVIEILKEKL